MPIGYCLTQNIRDACLTCGLFSVVMFLTSLTKEQDEDYPVEHMQTVGGLFGMTGCALVMYAYSERSAEKGQEKNAIVVGMCLAGLATAYY